MDVAEPVSMWELVDFGYTLGTTRHLSENSLLLSGEDEDQGVVDRLKALRVGLVRLQLEESDHFARRKFTTYLVPWFENLNSRGEVSLGGWVGDVEEALDQLLDCIQNEASRRYLFPVATSEQVNVEKALKDPSDLWRVPQFLEPPLPDALDGYLREAGRCLAVGFGPAAILFTLLATEVIIRYYYEIVVEEPAPPRALGKLIPKLKRKGCPDNILTYLIWVKDYFRNPAMHPDQKEEDKFILLESDDVTALGVWDGCSKLAQMLIEDLRERGKIEVIDV